MHSMSIAALFTIVKIWKSFKCPLIYKWRKTLWYIYVYFFIHLSEDCFHIVAIVIIPAMNMELYITLKYNFPISLNTHPERIARSYGSSRNYKLYF